MADGQLRLAVSLAVGIGPAVALMWLSLRRFDYPLAPKALFDDRKLFLAFAVGMGFGVVASLLTLMVSTSGIGLILPLLAVALFEESFKLAYLNRPSYRGRFDTTFYGASLGVGSGATLVVASAFLVNPDIAARPDEVLFLALFSLSTGLALASTGSLIGFGAAHAEVLRYFPRAVLIRVSHLLILLLFFVGEDVLQSTLSLGASLAFAGVVYAYVYREVLPETLPPDVRRELRKWRVPAKGTAGGGTARKVRKD